MEMYFTVSAIVTIVFSFVSLAFIIRERRIDQVKFYAGMGLMSSAMWAFFYILK